MRIVIDCDPGVDDALMLALALASPEVEVLAVTTVAGNADVDVTTANAASILRLCDRDDIPVATGARRALVHAYGHDLPPPHGENGVGGVVLPPGAERDERHAVELLRDVLASNAAGSVTVVATAPLTNIALLLALYPQVADRIGRVIVMGGGVGTGNITPVAEFNTWCDPESTHRVFTQPDLDVCMVGLDITRRARLSAADVQVLANGSSVAATLARMVAGYADFDDKGWAMHDAVIVAALLQPGLLTTQRGLVHVDTSSGSGRGQTIVEFRATEDARVVGRFPYVTAAALEIATDLDVDAFRRLVVGRLADRSTPAR